MLILSSGAGLIFYFRYEKARMERKRVAEATKGERLTKVGGRDHMGDQTSKPFTDQDMKGKYSLVSIIRILGIDTELIEIRRYTSTSPNAPTSTPKNSTKRPK